MTTPDVGRPKDDPYGLLQSNWPKESEGAYRAAEVVSSDASVTAQSQAASADDAQRLTVEGMKGRTADSVSDAYAHLSRQFQQQSQTYTTIGGWMTDAAGKISGAKGHISDLVRTGTSEIKDALDSELRGTPVTPSSSELTNKYRLEISSAASKLGTDLDSIGHSLHGDPGASTTPTYVRASSTPTTPTVEQAAVHRGITGESQPQVTPQKLPPMPRATTSSNTESASSASTPATPSAPSAPHPTLANLIGGQGSTPTSTPGGTASPHPSSQGSPSTPSPQAHQQSEHHQQPKSTGLPRIPSIPLPDLPNIPLDTITTAVSAATGHQLPTTPSVTSTQSVPVSTGITPGVPGTSPMTPMAPGLSPIGGGGLSTPAVTQPTTPAVQGTPVAPSPAPQQTTTPSPTRSPVVDAAWLQRNYGLAPGIESPKPEPLSVPALFITELSEPEALLHRVLGTLRQQFEQVGWAQPLAVATIRRGFETRLVYVTADAVSIHPRGVLLPIGVTPLDEIPTAPACSELSGSIMVTEKLKALVPSGWEVQSMLSTVPSDEQHQSTEQYQELSEAGELLPCGVSRGREGVEAGEAMSVFARVAIGSGGCGELDVESARLRAARWVGTQPVGYLEVLGRWYLADAAESMSQGNWAEAVYSAERYLSVVDTKSQAA
ncbi:hypothetical protein [Mycobacteroides abscessus]|uniref:hypothetical protein n=1 Tax=Mycobacteroides abscessus TaxID=36809 RepID=UPI0005E00423|nr:hypothetical protein [Mycobacteroides abscessus]CPW82829.1 Uncharacterised protein [Mycobacteroides abscessus]